MTAPFKRFAYISPKLEPVNLPAKGGYGLVAREPIAADERLLVWGGVVMDADRLAALSAIQRRRSVQIDEGLYLVTPTLDEPADFINHSCDPNAGIRGQVVVVAMRDITPGEEVTFDYAMTDTTPYDEFSCSCKAPHCRHRVRADDWMRPDLQERYRGYFSLYIQRRIEALAVPA
jgi:hypothetical protein